MRGEITIQRTAKEIAKQDLVIQQNMYAIHGGRAGLQTLTKQQIAKEKCKSGQIVAAIYDKLEVELNGTIARYLSQACKVMKSHGSGCCCDSVDRAMWFGAGAVLMVLVPIWGGGGWSLEADCELRRICLESSGISTGLVCVFFGGLEAEEGLSKNKIRNGPLIDLFTAMSGNNSSCTIYI
ncbi:hypothetical protein L195_g025138, partial [Trifolium pratense]